MTVSGASPRRVQSLRGHTSNARQRTSHGIARRLPAAGEGFAVMSGCAHGVAPVQGSCIYPTRNFATLGMLLLRDRTACDVVRSFLPDSLSP